MHEYRSIIEKRLHHFLLCDEATFQFGYIFDHDQIIQHRLCYYPYPVRITNDDLENISYGEDFVSDFLEEQPTTLTEYNETLVRQLIEKVTVYENKYSVEFTSGMMVDVEI